MPDKETVNKSAEIRKLHTSGVKSASEIVSKLKTQNIKVTPALVYNVLATKKAKKKSKKKAANHSGQRETIVDHAVSSSGWPAGCRGPENCFRNSRCCTTKTIQNPSRTKTWQGVFLWAVCNRGLHAFHEPHGRSGPTRGRF